MPFALILRIVRDLAVIPLTALVVWLAVAALPPSEEAEAKQARSGRSS